MAVRAAKSRNTTIQEEEARIWTQHEIKVNTTEKNSAVGASIEPLVQLYRKHCIEFDQVWGWDPRWSEKQFWARVPEWERHKITYFNEYVNATEQSALGVLRRTARPEDFVVFKLDIDTPHVEQQIMDILLSEEGKVYTDLIDEFYFEYQGGEGGPFLLDSPNTTVSYGVQMLQQLRRRGVRTHFWV